MPKIRANDVELWYQEAGSGPEPLVLVHGYTSSHGNWVETIPRLPADRFHIYAFDLRGAGQSDRPASGYTPEQYADDIAGAMQGLGVDTFHFVGHSMGGLTGMQLALRHPNRLRTLTLVAPAPAAGIQGGEEMVALMRAARGDARKFRIISELNMGGRPLRDELLDIMVEDGMSCSEGHFEESWTAMQNTAIAERLGQIAAPALMVVGDRDALRPSNLEDAARIPNCGLHVFYRVGHMIPWEAPQEFADLLVDFIDHGVAPPLDLDAMGKQVMEILQTA